jgi:hypothetical protein
MIKINNNNNRTIPQYNPKKNSRINNVAIKQMIKTPQVKI